MIVQINKQLLKLVDVVNTADMTLDDHIEKELLLMKLDTTAGGDGDLAALVDEAGARVLDDAPETFTVELTATSDRIDSFIEQAGRQAGILAVVRSGAMAIARGHNVLGANF